MSEAFSALLPVLLTVAALLLPVAALTVSNRVLHLVAPPAFFRIPALPFLPKLAGFALGIGALYDRDDAAAYDPTVLFDVSSFWDMTALDFLTSRADPSTYNLIGLLLGAFTGLPDPLLGDLMLYAGGMLVLAGVVALITTRDIELGRVFLAISVVTLSMAFLTVYMVSLVLWVAHLLNFWIFLLVAMVYQMGRHAASHH
jgi:hypothetical protein